MLPSAVKSIQTENDGYYQAKGVEIEGEMWSATNTHCQAPKDKPTLHQHIATYDNLYDGAKLHAVSLGCPKRYDDITKRGLITVKNIFNKVERFWCR